MEHNGARRDNHPEFPQNQPFVAARGLKEPLHSAKPRRPLPKTPPCHPPAAGTKSRPMSNAGAEWVSAPTEM